MKTIVRVALWSLAAASLCGAKAALRAEPSASIPKPSLTENNKKLTHPASELSEVDHATGLGDTMFMELVSPGPNLVGNGLLGAGSSFVFPMATSANSRQGSWQVGPTETTGSPSKKWILGGLVQNCSSFGESFEQEDHPTDFQPFATYFFGNSWGIGYFGNILGILANWNVESAGDIWTVPTGVMISKSFEIRRTSGNMR